MGKMSTHGTPTEGSTCACCWDDLTSENYVEYLPCSSSNEEISSVHESENKWLPSGFCESCIGHLLRSQFSLWTESLAKSTCLAEQRRLLRRGPPVNLRDDKALPCPENGEVRKLWYMSTPNEEKSAKLEGSLVGEVSACCDVLFNFSCLELLLIFVVQ
jgi:hypothetical protein